jgi:ParB/RepB/Spo0J family partition protein
MPQNRLVNHITRRELPPLVVLATPSPPRWELRVDQIEPLDGRGARRYEESALDALATSIRAWGQLQPILVRRVGSTYQVVCGERRWRAIQRAGLPTVWAVEHSATDLQSIALRLAENLHHISLSHAEKIAALDQLGELVGNGGLRETARQLGIDPSWLSRQLGIRCDPILFPVLERGLIGFGQAAELRRAAPETLPALLERVLTSESRVSTGTIRRWVRETRRRQVDPPQPVTAESTHGAGAAATDDSGFAALLAQVRALKEPSTADECEALEQIVSTARRLLAGAKHEVSPQASAPVTRMARTEVSCLMCGELAGLRDESGVLELISKVGVRQVRDQVRCGRCGGVLTTGALDVRYVRGAAGGQVDR